ncbi:hypothetical protein P22_2651 [Propionispora sp. 2/2-37]|uniref:chemotaxis protein CheX n=1 Tax=Propionispora sp. 2/2-37 TaxID=1677858 RepID=UPI0006BB7514|nr:chemotaxis protein CheX [Propionispora sp. 2/2-37]CUH96561.1 hypothetical protein P22_2651 [Propionispora sp. 2/2-37]
MDASFVNPFIAAISSVLPQLGFKTVERTKVFPKDQYIEALGVTINVGLANQVTGNVVFNMTVEAARGLSSTIMMGAAVNQLDSMAQSALCEMANMVAANAANALNNEGMAIQLAPPALSQSTSQFKVCNGSCIVFEMLADNQPFQIGIGVN